MLRYLGGEGFKNNLKLCYVNYVCSQAKKKVSDQSDLFVYEYYVKSYIENII